MPGAGAFSRSGRRSRTSLEGDSGRCLIARTPSPEPSHDVVSRTIVPHFAAEQLASQANLDARPIEKKGGPVRQPPGLLHQVRHQEDGHVLSEILEDVFHLNWGAGTDFKLVKIINFGVELGAKVRDFKTTGSQQPDGTGSEGYLKGRFGVNFAFL